MTVLAHGAAGPADGFILLVPAIALLVLAIGALRRRNVRAAKRPKEADGPGTAQSADQPEP